MKRFFVALGAAALLVGSWGCCTGPQHNRLYVHEWRANRRDPIPMDKDWVYEGEHYERSVAVAPAGAPAK